MFPAYVVKSASVTESRNLPPGLLLLALLLVYLWGAAVAALWTPSYWGLMAMNVAKALVAVTFTSLVRRSEVRVVLVFLAVCLADCGLLLPTPIPSYNCRKHVMP